MKKTLIFAALAALTIAPASVLAGPVTMASFASPAPNVYGSPSWPGYLTNAIAGIDNLGAATGTPGDPTYYQSGTAFDAGAFVVSSFNSWMGEVDPPAPYDAEYGTRMHFGLRAEAVTPFRLEDLNFEMHSSDPADSLAFVGDFVGLAYSATRVGINYGTDGMRGTSDDVIYDSGEAASNFVNLLLYVGVGNAFWPALQADMADTLAYIASNGGAPGPFTMTTRYYFSGESTGSVEAQATTTVPEPASLSMLGIGIGAVGFAGHRRRRQRVPA